MSTAIVNFCFGLIHTVCFVTSLQQLRAGSASLNLTTQEKLELDGNFASTLIKLLYAFVWQEWVVSDDPIILDPDINSGGAALLPVLNAYANSLNNYPIYDQDLQVFPSEDQTQIDNH